MEIPESHLADQIADIYTRALRRADREVQALLAANSAPPATNDVQKRPVTRNRAIEASVNNLYAALTRNNGGATIRTVMRQLGLTAQSIGPVLTAFRAQGGQVIHIRYVKRSNRTRLIVLPGLDPGPLVPDGAEIA